MWGDKVSFRAGDVKFFDKQDALLVDVLEIYGTGSGTSLFDVGIQQIVRLSLLLTY